MKKPNPPAALCLPLALLCSAVQADDTPSRFELGILEPVLVDGSRVDFSDAATQDTVDANDMARFNRTDVSQALDLLPGVNTVMMGGRGERLINVRGFDSRQVPLFIDGIPVYVPYDGNIDLSRLTTYDIAEISVSKGYTSLLAGPGRRGGRRPGAPGHRYRLPDHADASGPGAVRRRARPPHPGGRRLRHHAGVPHRTGRALPRLHRRRQLGGPGGRQRRAGALGGLRRPP
ncbi:Plug domain-containing protein [Alcanivorax sp. ZXX171]|nr:Plug domain-containing protein [Alcanivorax sp. ZXX171]